MLNPRPRCIDFLIWYPKRKHALNRSPTKPVIGVSNYDRCRKVYYLLTEIDGRGVDVNGIISKYKNALCMVVETAKGYHFYFDICSENPLKVIHTGYKMRIFDRGQLSMAKKRYYHTGDRDLAFLVLRVSPKYNEPDLRIVYFSDKCSEWFHQVRALIEVFNSA